VFLADVFAYLKAKYAGEVLGIVEKLSKKGLHMGQTRLT